MEEGYRKITQNNTRGRAGSEIVEKFNTYFLNGPLEQLIDEINPSKTIFSIKKQVSLNQIIVAIIRLMIFFNQLD